MMNLDAEMRALLKSIRRLSRAMEIQSRRADRAVGLTLPQLVVLGACRDLGEVTTRALSAEADISAPTVVGVLDKLEAKGLIERYRSRVDRRIVHARLTPAGAEALRRAPPPLGERFAARFARLAPERRLRMAEALAALADLAAEDVGCEPPAEPLTSSAAALAPRA